MTTATTVRQPFRNITPNQLLDAELKPEPHRQKDPEMRDDVVEITEGVAKPAQYSSTSSTRLPHSYLIFSPNPNDFIREPFALSLALRRY